MRPVHLHRIRPAARCRAGTHLRRYLDQRVGPHIAVAPQPQGKAVIRLDGARANTTGHHGYFLSRKRHIHIKSYDNPSWPCDHTVAIASFINYTPAHSIADYRIRVVTRAHIKAIALSLTDKPAHAIASYRDRPGRAAHHAVRPYQGIHTRAHRMERAYNSPAKRAGTIGMPHQGIGTLHQRMGTRHQALCPRSQGMRTHYQSMCTPHQGSPTLPHPRPGRPPCSDSP